MCRRCERDERYIPNEYTLGMSADAWRELNRGNKLTLLLSGDEVVKKPPSSALWPWAEPLVTYVG